jgi:hypothetical protein
MKFLGTVFTATLIAALSASADPGEGPDRKALFGELHLHTTWSFDAYYMGTRNTPDDAYEFAKGMPKKHSNGKTFQIQKPLDFMAVTDHGIFLGVYARMGDPTHPLSKLPVAKIVTSGEQGSGRVAFDQMLKSRRSDTPTMEGLDTPETRKEVWDLIIASANRHNAPGKFTAFVAYEWGGGRDGKNLHRNVIFKGDTAPPIFTSLESGKPEDLWAWMEEIRKDGHTVLAIPHNLNLSDGAGYETQDSWGNELTPEYAEMRNRNEPLVEVTQIKGTSETHPSLSPNDEFADFGISEFYVSGKQPLTVFKGSFVRDAYRTGLELQDKQGFNPYRFGLVGATDSHTGLTATEEKNYPGGLGNARGRSFGGSGLAGVWSKENTRESIYETLERKETWGTTGPRIQVRFFGGFDMASVDPGKEGWVEAAYEKGVSMGANLKATDASAAPTFAVWAVKDPDSANLDRIQIVKGWSSAGVSHEQIYDVAWSGDRSIDPETGDLEPVGNTVNLDTLEYSNSIGAVELKGTWTDPKFRADHNAFYYVRVLEIPTPRWSSFVAKKQRMPFPTDVSSTIQERAYTSPIRYDRD